MRPEKEIERRDHAEEADGLEYEAGEDADGRQDGDQRCTEQDGHDHPFDLAARREIGLQPKEGIGAGEEGNQQRDDDADRVVVGQRVAIGFDER